MQPMSVWQLILNNPVWVGVFADALGHRNDRGDHLAEVHDENEWVSFPLLRLLKGSKHPKLYGQDVWGNIMVSDRIMREIDVLILRHPIHGRFYFRDSALLKEQLPGV